MQVLGGAWTLVILGVTTMPWSNFKGHAHWGRVYWVPLSDFRLSFSFIADLIGNLLLFVPFGLCFVAARLRMLLNLKCRAWAARGARQR